MNQTTVALKMSDDGQAAKFAVVRLKPGDNLLGLFQLLIHNGFGEVSFVNNLQETIFPSLSAAKLRAASPAPESVPKIDDSRGHTVIGTEKLLQPLIMDKMRSHQMPPPAQNRTVTIDNRICPPPAPIEPILQQKSNPDSNLINDELNRARRAAMDLNLLSQAAVNAPASVTTFSTTPSNFLGLPTLPSLNTSAAAAAAIAALSEAATPPYSLANFFTPNTLSTTMPLQAPINSAVHQYSPALLAAAAAVQQRQTATAVSSIAPPRPRSPPIQSLSAPSLQQQINRSQMAAQPQQRIHMNQPSFQFQQQFQLSTVQPRLAFSQQPPQQPQQQNKPLPQKSPAESPGSSSNSSSQSGRMVDGMLSSNCAPMPPGCATTQLRQRGQRSYAEDPSLYVACRLCKNKIMGSRISNLTNHVRRHSSMKQFQCCYCDYTHNEMAKVRLHMLHNHKDKDSQPIDNLSPEMQASWDLLMKECFPDHCQQQQQPQPTSATSPSQPTVTALTNGTVASLISQHLQLQCQAPTASAMSHVRGELSLQQITSQIRSESVSNGSTETVPASPSQDDKTSLQILVQRRESENNASPTSTVSTSSIADAVTPPAIQPQTAVQVQPQYMSRCIACGLYVNSKLKARHIRKCHLQGLLPFACSMCGYDHSEHSKVKVHICLKHDDDPMAQVVTRDVSTYAEQLAPEYFPIDNEIQYAAAINAAPTLVSTEPVVERGPVNAASPETTLVDQKTQNDTVIVYGDRTLPDHGHKLENGGRKILRCRICRRNVPTVRAAGHARKHVLASSLFFVCPVCGRYKTANSTLLRRHLESKHMLNADQVKPFIFRRASAAAASSGSTSKRHAAGRCFPTALKCIRVSKIARNIIRRYRHQKDRKSKSKCSLRKSMLKISRIRKTNSVRKLIRPVNGVRSVLTAQNIDPSIKEPKVDLANNSTQSVRLCPLCAHWIRTDQLGAHLQTHMPSPGSSYRCNLCEFAATDPLIVRAHFLQEHQKLQAQQHQSHDAHHQAALLMTYVNLCRGSSSTATAADG